MEGVPCAETLFISQLTRNLGNVTLPLSCHGELADGSRLCREACRKLKLHSEVNSYC